MRIEKIDRLQQGGGIPPYVSYINVPDTPIALPTGEASTKKEENNLLDDKAKALLYENGIPSDVKAFVENSGIFVNDLYSSPFDKGNSMLKYKMLTTMLPKIKFESDNFKKAMERADKNEGLGEIAVTDGGFVITINKEGRLSKKDLREVDLESEHILTNSELADYRANNASAAFNTEITNIIGNAIGIPKITEYIQSVINKLGTTSMSREGYIGVQSGKLLKGMEYLASLNPSASELSGMSSDGLYKVSNVEESQVTQAEQAISYLLSTLPKNMRTVLQAKAATELNDNSIEGVKKLLILLTKSAMKGSRTFSVDLQTSKKGDGTSSGSSKGDDVDPVKAFYLGLGEVKPYKINNGNSFSLNLYGNSAPLTDTSGKTLGGTTLSEAARSSFSGGLDFKNATMGGLLINSSQRDRVAVDGSNIVAVDLPLDVEALERGIVKPDINSLKNLELADNIIKTENITDPNEINKVYESYHLPYKYINGQLNTSAYRRFAVFDSYATEDAFEEDPKLEDTVELVKDIHERDGVARILKAADSSFELDNPNWLNLGGDPLYSGSVYVPIINNIINASLGSGNYYKDSKVNTLDALEQQKNRLQSYVKPTSLSSLK